MKPFSVDYVVEYDGNFAAVTKDVFDKSADKVRYVIKTFQFKPTSNGSTSQPNE